MCVGFSVVNLFIKNFIVQILEFYKIQFAKEIILKRFEKKIQLPIYQLGFFFFIIFFYQQFGTQDMRFNYSLISLYIIIIDFLCIDEGK
jgi:hypothetical protein